MQSTQTRNLVVKPTDSTLRKYSIEKVVDELTESPYLPNNIPKVNGGGK